MSFWKVEYEREVELALHKDFSSGRITREDIVLLKTWVREMVEHGPEYIQESRIWDDHPLEKEWRGYRSSCFSSSGRIIYRIENDKIVVRVVRITPSHDYRRGGNK